MRVKASGGEVKQVTDQLDVTQAKMVLGFYRYQWRPEKIAAARLMVAIYGGTPFSFVSQRQGKAKPLLLLRCPV